MPTDRHPSPWAPDDPLLRRYHEANALDAARPPAALRDAVLAQARAAAVRSARPAANDSRWSLRALGTLAVLGLVGLLVLQFDRETGVEREVALGTSPAVRSPGAEVAAVPSAPAPASAVVASPAPVVPSREPSPAAAARERSTAPAAPLRREAPVPAALPAAPPAAPAVAPQKAAAPAGAPAFPPADALPESVRRARGGAALGEAAQSTDAVSPSRTPDTAITTPSATDAVQGMAAAPGARRTEQAATRAAGLPVAARLLTAAARGDDAAVRAALAAGAEVNTTDSNGRTALMLAAERGHHATVRALLDGGADAGRADRQGLTAVDLARRAGQTAVVPLLEAPAVR